MILFQHIFCSEREEKAEKIDIICHCKQLLHFLVRGLALKAQCLLSLLLFFISCYFYKLPWICICHCSWSVLNEMSPIFFFIFLYLSVCVYCLWKVGVESENPLLPPCSFFFLFVVRYCWLLETCWVWCWLEKSWTWNRGSCCECCWNPSDWRFASPYQRVPIKLQFWITTLSTQNSIFKQIYIWIYRYLGSSF